MQMFLYLCDNNLRKLIPGNTTSNTFGSDYIAATQALCATLNSSHTMETIILCAIVAAMVVLMILLLFLLLCFFHPKFLLDIIIKCTEPDEVVFYKRFDSKPNAQHSKEEAPLLAATEHTTDPATTNEEEVKQPNHVEKRRRKGRIASCDLGSSNGIISSAAVKVVALTIDDAPHEAITPLILDLLKEHGCRATFFCIGTPLQLKCFMDQFGSCKLSLSCRTCPTVTCIHTF